MNRETRPVDIHLIYAFAHVEAWVEAYAKANHRVASELANGVGGLLLSQGSRDIDHLPLPGLRSEAAGSRGTVEQEEVAGSSHLHGSHQSGKKKGHPMSASVKQRLSRLAKARWAKKNYAKKKAARIAAEKSAKKKVVSSKKAPAGKNANYANAQKNYWAKMSKAERAREMARRVAVHQAKVAAAKRASKKKAKSITHVSHTPVMQQQPAEVA